MSRARAALLSVPLLVLGTLLAHGLTYRIAYPDAADRALADAAAGHGYLDQLRFVMTACVALVVVALALIALEARRRDERGTVPAWLFGSLPLVGFTAQELVERVASGQGFGLEDISSTTFVLGLLLQLPIAALMYVVARLLSRIAVELSETLARAGADLRVWPTDPRRSPWSTFWLEPHVATLELRRGGRAPPHRLDRR